MALLGSVTAAATAAPAPRSLSTGPRSSHPGLTAVSAGGDLQISGAGSSLEDAIRAQVGSGSPTAHADALRTFLLTTTGLELPDLRPETASDDRGPRPPRLRPDLLGDDTETPEEAPPLGQDGTVTHPSPGGDLDGDGTDDALVFELRLPQDEIAVRALRGSNGTQMWTRKLDGADEAIGVPVGDLTGDGNEDLILWSFDLLSETTSDDCDTASDCRLQYDATFRWTVGLRSGQNGQVLWAKTFPGEDHYLYVAETEETAATATAHEEERLTSTNYVVAPYLSGDHNGDGLADLVLDAIDLDLDYESDQRSVAGGVVEDDAGQWSMHGATRAELASGLTGETIQTRASEMGPGIAELQPLDDMVGNAAPELLWEEEVAADSVHSCLEVAGVDHCPDPAETGYSLELELMDGSTLARAWGVTLGGIVDGSAEGLRRDVTADGVEDILVYVTEPGSAPLVTRLLSGADGSEVWERPQVPNAFTWEVPLVVEDLTGDAAADLVLGTFIAQQGDQGTGHEAARFTRVNGTNGATLSSTTRPFPSLSPQDFVFSYLYLDGGGDADGDGVGDVVAGSLRAGYEQVGPEEYRLAEARSAAQFESGRFGEPIYGVDAPRMFTVEMPADLDGDGLTDAIEWMYPSSEEDPHGVSIHSLEGGAMLWTRPLASDEFWKITVAGDHDGLSGQDLLYGRDELHGNSWKSRVASLHGATGSERWVLQL